MSAETAILGACMADPKAYWRVADLLVADDFAIPVHRRLYGLIRDRANAQEAFDAVTIGEVDPGLHHLALELALSEDWRVNSVRSYAEMVARSAIVRRVKQAGQQIAHLDGDDVLGQAQQLLGSCLPRHAGQVKHIREYLRASVAELQRRVNAKEALTGIPTSIPDLDDMLCGFQPGDLIVIAARPSIGKTAFTVQALVNAARQGKRVLFFSLEMTGVKIADRIQAHIAQVNAAGMKRPALFDDADFGALFNAATEIAELPLYIDETPGLPVEALNARARQAHATTGVDLIAIDYLTQMTPPSGPKLNTADALQIITRSLKGLGKELNAPVILLSQLNRDGDGHRPTLKTLRDSGAIEQDADVVMFLHRPDPNRRNEIQLIVEKQRDGETGDIWLDANYRHQRFTPMEAPAQNEQPQKRGFRDFGNRRTSNGAWNGYND